MTNSAVVCPAADNDAVSPSPDNRVGLRLARGAVYLVAAALVLSTLAFGGAHRSTTLWASIALALAFVLATFAALRLGVRTDGSLGVTFIRAALWWLLLWSLMQPWIYGPFMPQHPILNGAVWLRDIESYQSSLRCIALAILTFECVILLACWRLRLDRVCACLIAFGACVAVIALIHWLYDNGKLFFVFSPDYVASQQRARWPFVNSNHLATFLLIPFALSAASIARYWGELLSSYENLAHHRIERLVASKRAQKIIFKWGASALGTTLIGVAILASFSRANWIASALIVFALLLSPRAYRSTEKKPKLEIVRKKSRRRAPKVLPGWIGLITRLFGRVGFLALFGLLVLFLLNDQGVELFQSRLEYSLLAAKDDIRWQLYRDSWGLFSQHLFLGIGLGAWHTSFSAVMNPLLSGLDAGFLHSDPLQLLIELGLIGFVPFALALLATLYYVLKEIWRSQRREAVMARALLIGVVATVFASSADFPFRMLSIQIQTIVCLSLLLLSVSQLRQNEATRPG